jgi:hypothetical protein
MIRFAALFLEEKAEGKQKKPGAAKGRLESPDRSLSCT